MPAAKRAGATPPRSTNKPASRAPARAARPDPALPQLQLFDVARVRRYDRNARTHPPEQIELIARLMVRHGFTNITLVDVSADHLLCFGHGRLEALEHVWSKGVEIEDMDVPPHHPMRRQRIHDVKFPSGFVIPRGKLPGLDCSGWTEEQRREAILADNQSALLAGWNAEMLRTELSWLKEQDGAALWATAFSEAEVARWTAPAGGPGLTDENEAPPVAKKAVSRLGDVWLLGHHRLVCGDSTDAATVSKLLGNVRPFLMVTDPPYGVEYDPSWRVKAGAASKGAALGKVKNDDRADWREAWALFPGTVAYVWHGGLHAATVAESLAACKLMIRSQIVWVKTRPVFSRGDYHWQHEPAYYAVRQGKDDKLNFAEEHELAAYAVKAGQAGGWEGDRKQSTVWQIEHLKNDTGHGTQKPVDCMRKPMLNNSPPGGAVYDPFVGSGTTVIAAETCGRIAYACELDPLYVDVVVRRWQAFTGKEATLEAGGKRFAELEAKRSR